MMSALYALPQAKMQAEATLNSEKIKPAAIAIAVIELHLSKGIRQAVSQSVENSIE